MILGDAVVEEGLLEDGEGLAQLPLGPVRQQQPPTSLLLCSWEKLQKTLQKIVITQGNPGLP